MKAKGRGVPGGGWAQGVELRRQEGDGEGNALLGQAHLLVPVELDVISRRLIDVSI